MNSWFFSEIFPLSPEKSLFTWPATFVPHPSFLNCLIGIVVTRNGSKHLPRVTHCRDFIENGQSVLPPTLLAKLFEKNLLTDTRDVTRLRHLPDCGQPRLQIEAIRRRDSKAGHVTAERNWMAR